MSIGLQMLVAGAGVVLLRSLVQWADARRRRLELASCALCGAVEALEPLERKGGVLQCADAEGCYQRRQADLAPTVRDHDGRLRRRRVVVPKGEPPK